MLDVCKKRHDHPDETKVIPNVNKKFATQTASRPPTPGFALRQSQAEFEEYLEKKILPVYKSPYLYQINNPFIKLNSLKVKRPIHGCKHIVDSLMFADMMVNIYVMALNVDPKRFDMFAIRHSIAYHDIARNGDGKDIWEKMSAEFAKNNMLEAYQKELSPEDILYIEYVANMIDKEYCQAHMPFDIDQLISQAADTIEILRLRDICDFEREKFYFLDPERDPIARQLLQEGKVTRERLFELRENFIKEANDWIQMTDTYENKAELETSKDYFGDVRKQFVKKSSRLPFLSQYFSCPMILEIGKFIT